MDASSMENRQNSNVWIWVGFGVLVVIVVVVIILMQGQTTSVASSTVSASDANSVLVPMVAQSAVSASTSISAPVSQVATPSCTAYKGCYVDSASRVLPTRMSGGHKTLQECYNEALALNPVPKYIGLQYWKGSGDVGKGECWYGNGPYDTLGVASNCTSSADAGYPGYAVGGSWSNAVYDTSCPLSL